MQALEESNLSDGFSYSKYEHNSSIIHILKVNKAKVKLKLVLSKEKLSETIKNNNALFGINAAYFNIDTFSPLLGFKTSEHESPILAHLPFIDFEDGQARITSEPKSEFCQLGPVLHSINEYNIFYFAKNQHLFDGYINQKKNPRSVFGHDDTFYYLITVDGRSKQSKGLYLEELIPFLKQLNIPNAINLDGGSSSTLIYNNKILNTPSGNSEIPLGAERKISSCIIGFTK